MTGKKEIEEVLDALYLMHGNHSSGVFSDKEIENWASLVELHVETIYKALQEKIDRLENGDWLPIESAPRTGERILLALEGYPTANYGHWYKIRGRFEYDGYDFANPEQQPTHWQPISPTPKQGNK